jgi:8-oxo-dGTP diphosphatase
MSEMHEIQKNILQKIAHTKGARYSELKDKNVDGNLFTYHLGILKKQNYIIAKGKSYLLTPVGKHLIDRMSFDSFKERIQPKIVTTIIIEDKGKLLLYRKKRSPFIDHVCFPYGKIHLEERLQDAVERELLEKSGLSATLKHKGDVYLTIHDETELVSHMLCHIFTGTKVNGELKTDYKGGQCFWGTFKDIEKEKVLPGAKQMHALTKKNKNKHFFAEYFLNTTDDFESK